MLLVTAAILSPLAGTDPITRIYVAVAIGVLFVANWAYVAETIIHRRRK